MSSESGSVRPGRVRTRQDFGRELTLLRERAGLSVRDVAGRVKVQGAHSTIGDWFAGRSLPSPASGALFVQVLGVCGVSDAEAVEQWVQAWHRVRRVPGRRAGGLEPYRGLSSFQPEHAEWFFGRQALTGQLAGRLADLDAADGGVQLVVGPSGSGKSSLLRAGLIPALAAGTVPGSQCWRVALLTPGPGPVDELAAGIAGVTGAAVSEVSEAVRADPDRWSLAVGMGGRAAGQGRLVVVVDQFEEVFAPYAAEDEGQIFVAAALAACRHAGAVVVLGLRADFYAQALRYPQLAAATAGQVVVGPMTEAELREAIAGPARKTRIDIEDGLVELLLREVAPASGQAGQAAHDAGVLPLLSHALYATWEQGQGRRMTAADYRRVGGIDGAVAASAGKVYDALTPVQRELARRLFLRLVHVTPGVADTRRRATTAELLAGRDGAQTAELDCVLDQFVGARLVTADTGTVEISHEAVLTAWPLLRAWVDSDRAGLVIGRRLHDAAHSWWHDGQDPAGLYRGTRLAAAQEWAAAHGDEQPPLVRDFLAASSSRQGDEQRRAQIQVRRRYQLVIALLTALVLIAAGSVAYSHKLQVIAERERLQALSRFVAGEADRLRGTDVSLSAQLALAAYRIAATPEARSSLLDSTAVPAASRVPSPPRIATVTVGDGGKLLADSTAQGQVRLWTVRANGQVSLATRSAIGPWFGSSASVALSAGGTVLAVEDGYDTLRLWNIADRARPRAMGIGGGSYPPLSALAFSGDGRTLVAQVDAWEGAVYLLNVSRPAHPALEARLTGSGQPITAFATSGSILATGNTHGTIRLWNIADRVRAANRAPLAGSRSEVVSLAISPDGRRLAAGTADGKIYLWNIADPAHPAPVGPPLTVPGGSVNAVAFSPDGTTLAAGAGTAAWLFSLRTRQVTGQLPHPTPVSAVLYRNDHSLITLDGDGTLRLWNVPGPVIDGVKGAVSAVSFDGTGHELAIVPSTSDSPVTVWNPDSIQRPAQVGPALASPPGAARCSAAGALTPDGRTFIAGCQDGTIRLWDIGKPAHPARIGPVHVASAAVTSITPMPGGRILAVAADDLTVRLLSIADPRHPVQLTTLPGALGGVQAAFSPRDHLLAIASVNDLLDLWDTTRPTRPRLMAAIGGFTGRILSVAFSPHGTILAAAGADNTVHLWDITRPRHPVSLGHPLTGPVGSINSVAFEPTGNVLAAGSNDGTIWLWDLARPRQPAELAILTGPASQIRAVAFSPHGHTLAAGSQNGTVTLWDTNPRSVAKLICATTGQPLTRQEWNQYIPGQPYNLPCQ